MTITETSYHISSQTGRVNKCSQGAAHCAEKQHFQDKGEALEAKSALKAMALGQELRSKINQARANWKDHAEGQPNPHTGEYSQDGKVFLLKSKLEAWYEQPLTEAEEDVRLRLAANKLLLTRDQVHLLHNLTVRRRYGGTVLWDKPAAPPVKTLTELEDEFTELEAKFGDFISLLPRLESLVSQLECEGIYEIALPEWKGECITTDLVRHLLAMDSRPKTKADRLPHRVAQVALLKLEEEHVSEELIEAPSDEDIFKQAEANLALQTGSAEGQVIVINAEAGLPVAMLTPRFGLWVATDLTTPNDTGLRLPANLGVYTSKDEALMQVLRERMRAFL